jgi:alpha-beta hydrolase superfamily lysophospholipase
MMRHEVSVLLAAAMLGLQGCGSQSLSPWHTERLNEEYVADDSVQVQTFDDYLQLEDRVFNELERKVYSQVDTGPEYGLMRYSSGSQADPQSYETNWNRSFEFEQDLPGGGVLLLHGMSDSPYSLHALAETLAQQNYWVVGLRMPGHGTAPSGMKYVKPEDMIAATRLAMAHLSASVGDKPIHIVGYSTGAALALNYSLDAAEGTASPMPASIVLISPAIRIHAAASLASFKRNASALPGLGGFAWLSVMQEFDPYKYNSFATNAADAVHQLTRAVDRRIAARAGSGPNTALPPILAIKSAVDATVTTEAIVDNLLSVLAPNRHELVLFDVNRFASKDSLLVDDPGPLTTRLMEDDLLPFGLTVIANRDTGTRDVVARRKEPLSGIVTENELHGLAWPSDVFSLSHVALPFPPDDPLYGSNPPAGDESLHLGDIPTRGERDMNQIPDEWLLRMRYNPFYEVLESRVLEWLQKTAQTTVTE